MILIAILSRANPNGAMVFVQFYAGS